MLFKLHIFSKVYCWNYDATLCEKCPNTEFFLRTKKKFVFGHYLRSAIVDTILLEDFMVPVSITLVMFKIFSKLHI